MASAVFTLLLVSSASSAVKCFSLYSGIPKTEAAIRALADKLEIAPGIIVGRLQNERVVAVGVGVE